MKLFEYCIIYLPKKKDGKKTTPKPKLLQDVKRRLGESEKEIMMLAAREIPQAHLDNLDEVEVCIRPFV